MLWDKGLHSGVCVGFCANGFALFVYMCVLNCILVQRIEILGFFLVATEECMMGSKMSGFHELRKEFCVFWDCPSG